LQPIDGHIGPASTATEVALIAVYKLLLGEVNQFFGLDPPLTFNVLGGTERPARTTGALITNRSNSSLLLPIPDIRTVSKRFIHFSVGEVFNVVELVVLWDLESHELLDFPVSKVSQMVDCIHGCAHFLGVLPIDDTEVGKVNSPAIEILTVRFVPPVVFFDKLFEGRVAISLNIEGCSNCNKQRKSSKPSNH
jgi:hypothetical protein